MELLVGLVLIGAVVLFLLFSKGTNGKHDHKPNLSRATDDVLAPFDPQRSIKIVDRTTLRGAAYVVDGDTLVINKIQIRLHGVDAPEMNHPFGKNAKGAMIKLCKGQIIRAEVIAQDTHGRTVAQCYLPDGRDLSAELVRQGFAIDWPKYSGGLYSVLETPDARRKMWLADARQKGRLDVWERFDAQQKARAAQK